ncbi:hypothetical protein ACYCO6_07380 [Methylobacterium sp. CM6257]|jgi:hypothetical protein
MEVETLERPASLKVWHAGAARFLSRHPEQFDSLREAIAAAAAVLIHPDRQPWIVTAEGDLLPPNWIRGSLKRDTPDGSGAREACGASDPEVTGSLGVMPGRGRAIRLGCA